MSLVRALPFTPAAKSASTRAAATKVVCRAALNDGNTVSRRAAFAGLLSVPALLSIASPALALLDYDDDEEMVSKAKARRAERLQEERATQRQFMKSEGLRDLRDRDVVPVQNGVYKLAKSGAEIEAGDLSSASSTLNSGWLSDFEKAVGSLSQNGSSQSSKDQLLTAVRSLETAASQGDVTGAKKGYISTVDAVLSWSKDAGLATSLKGL